jgi:hypothetical protein
MTPAVGGNVAGKDGQRAPHEAHRSIGMAARPAPVHFTQTIVNERDVFAPSFAAGQPGHIVSDCGEPVDARTALTGVLVGQVACDPGRFGETAGCLPEHHDHSGAGCGANRA